MSYLVAFRMLYKHKQKREHIVNTSNYAYKWKSKHTDGDSHNKVLQQFKQTPN